VTTVDLFGVGKEDASIAKRIRLVPLEQNVVSLSLTGGEVVLKKS